MTSLVHNRVLLTRLLFLPLLVLILFSSHPWREGGYLELTIEALGFIFLVVATFGRVWCLTYIGGYKHDVLMTTGPYSIVRNPLYLFSFIGAVGLGFTTENLMVLGLAVAMFALYYPFTVLKEERALEWRFGEQFHSYAKRTPRWLPNFSLFIEPETYQVKPAFIRRSILGSMWFLWLALAWELVEKLQDSGVLPILF